MGDTLCGAILCGGASRRMGTSKALLDIDGEALIARVHRLLRDVCGEVVAVGGDPAWAPPGCGWVADPVAGAGPLAGVAAALRACAAERCGVVAVDMPDVDAELLAMLAAACDGHDAAVPLHRGRPEPLHAVYDRRAAAVAERRLHGDDRSMRGLLGELDVVLVDPVALVGAERASRFAVNLNDPEDVRRRRSRR